jgi:hypothetical protein
MEYDGLKPLPIWWILVYGLFHKNWPNTYIIFTDRGNHIPSDIPTYRLNFFDVSLIRNEIQIHGAVTLVSGYTAYIWHVKLTWNLWKTLKSWVLNMVITFRLATAKNVPDPGWNLTCLPPSWNSCLYKS